MARLANKKRTILAGAIVDVVDDGLISPEVGSWAEEKHDVVSLYAKLFSTGMKNKWHERVYIELYAGAGHAKIRDSSRIIAGSPIRALLLPDPFDKYIFCEADHESIEALQLRVKRVAPFASVTFIEGNCNEKVGDVLAAIPAHSWDHRVLSLCFVDPYDIGIKFSTLALLSDKFIDFLLLLALYMDAARNQENYLKDEAVKIDEFLGRSDIGAKGGGRHRQVAHSLCNSWQKSSRAAWKNYDIAINPSTK